MFIHGLDALSKYLCVRTSEYNSGNSDLGPRQLECDSLVFTDIHDLTVGSRAAAGPHRPSSARTHGWSGGRRRSRAEVEKKEETEIREEQKETRPEEASEGRK